VTCQIATGIDGPSGSAVRRADVYPSPLRPRFDQHSGGGIDPPIYRKTHVWTALRWQA
jgi:hypothetical protein